MKQLTNGFQARIFNVRHPYHRGPHFLFQVLVPQRGTSRLKPKMRSSASRQNSSIRSKRPAIAACIRTSSQCEPLGRTPSLGPEHRTCTELLRSTPHNPVSTSFRRHRIRSPWRRFLCAPTQARTRGTSSTKMKALALKVLFLKVPGE